MISFLGREDRVTKSGGPVTTLNLFVVKASYEIICFPAKSHWGVSSVLHRTHILQEKMRAQKNHVPAPQEVCCPTPCDFWN